MDVLTCFLTRRRLDALVDGALGEPEQRQASAHVAGCQRCRREADELRRLRTMIQRTFTVSSPSDWSGFWAGVARGIEDRRGVTIADAPAWTPGRLLWARPRLSLGSAVAAALLASVAVWQFWGPEPGVQESAVFVRSANTEVPGISLMVYSPPERDMAVVWMLENEDVEE